MDNTPFQRITITAIIVLAGAWLSLHTYSSITGSGLWAFQSCHFIPDWYLAIWGVFLAGMLFAIYRFHEQISKWFENRNAGITLLAALLALIGILYNDSFVFGGGNLRVARIAQVDRIILDPHEYGSLATVAGLFQALKFLGLKSETAGVWGWRIFAFACSALSIFGAVRLARLIAPSSGRRLAITAVTLFAGPFLMLCGYIGIEPVIVTATIWFSIAAYRLADRCNLPRLLAVWWICLGSIIMAVSTAFLIPAAICVTIGSVWRRNWNWLIGAFAGLVCWNGLFGWLYYEAGRSVWLAQFLVMPDGKLPFTNYSLLSVANLSDKGLIVLAVAPLSLLLLILVWRRLHSMTDRIFAVTIVVATIAGRVTQVAVDPVNGIVLDFPRLTAYLSPLAIALAFFLDRQTTELAISGKTALLALALSVMIPLLSAPGYTKIDNIEPLAKTYAENNDHYYRTTGLAFRDAYFYRKNLDKANSWEWSLPIKSPDFLNMRGCFDLVANGQHADALVSLHRLVARQPYWAEPRALLVIVQLKLGRMSAAKAHLDTCLMLEPYGKPHWINRYQYFQAVRRFDSAYVAVREARRLFFGDKEIASEAMVIAFQAGSFAEADSLASGFLKADSISSYAHLIKARLADQKGLKDSAIAEYRRFILAAPKGNPDVDMVQNRLMEIEQK